MLLYYILFDPGETAEDAMQRAVHDVSLDSQHIMWATWFIRTSLNLDEIRSSLAEHGFSAVEIVPVGGRVPVLNLATQEERR